jgi:phospholipid/cholesterol/gamma-HCH transport system substrate-binding protein
MSLFDRPLRDRNMVVVGIVGTAVLVGALALVVLLPRVPALSGTQGYSADFAQAAGISSGDDVRVAGIPVGQVTSVKLDRDNINHRAVVKVGFKVSRGTHLGSQTSASIEVATLLGTKYVELTPAGTGSLSTAGPIPVTRTAVPFDLSQVTNSLSSTVGGLDIPQIRKALNTVSSTFSGTPSATKQALNGLSGISKVIAERQGEFQELLASARQVTATLDQQKGTIDALFNDADQVLQTVRERRAIIHSLLVDSATLGAELDHLVKHNEATLGPLLDRLHTVAGLLHQDDRVLGQSVDLLAPASRGLANATGDGPYIGVNLPYLLLPDNVLCAFSVAKDCR